MLTVERGGISSYKLIGVYYHFKLEYICGSDGEYYTSLLSIILVWCSYEKSMTEISLRQKKVSEG